MTTSGRHPIRTWCIVCGAGSRQRTRSRRHALVAPPAPAGEGGWGLAYCASKASFHQIAIVTDVEFRSHGVRAFTMEPGYTVTERHIATGNDDRYSKGFHGDPPEVAGEVIGFLAAEPEADRFRGRMVHAQALCAKYELVPGWSPHSCPYGFPIFFPPCNSAKARGLVRLPHL